MKIIKRVMCPFWSFDKQLNWICQKPIFKAIVCVYVIVLIGVWIYAKNALSHHQWGWAFELAAKDPNPEYRATLLNAALAYKAQYKFAVLWGSTVCVWITHYVILFVFLKMIYELFEESEQ